MNLEYWCNSLECHRSSPLRYKTYKQQSNIINHEACSSTLSIPKGITRIVYEYYMYIVSKSLIEGLGTEKINKGTYNSVGLYAFKKDETEISAPNK